MADNQLNLQIIDVLEGIRRRIIFTALLLVALSAGVYVYLPQIMGDMITDDRLQRLVFLSPAEGFLAKIKLSLALGFVLVLPFVLFQVWAMTASRLPRLRDKIFTFFLIPVAFGLFVGGAAFGYFAVLPFALRFFLGFADETLKPLISVGSYVSFLVMFVLPFGVIFETPVIVMFLARLGLVNGHAMRKKRKFAILGIFILAAALTPADAVSQVLMAVPMMILYEISIVVARIFYRERSFGEPAER